MASEPHKPYKKTAIKCLYTLFVFCLSMLAHHATAAQINEESDPIQPLTLSSSERFTYFQDSLVVEFDLAKREDISNFTGTLLSVRSNNDNHVQLFIDWSSRRKETNLYMTYGEHINRFTITDSLLFLSPEKTPVRIMLDFHRDFATISIGSNLIPIYGMGLSVQNGYKFELLPVLSASPVPNVKPVLEISSLYATYNNRGFLQSTWYWYVLIVIVDLLIFLWVHLRRQKMKRLLASRHSALQSGDSTDDDIFTIEVPKRSAVFLFGGFQVFDREGDDITKRFSPLLKELFCLILTHSTKKGISSDKLNEILWFDKDRVSAKNNRAVNIGKLRAILDQVGEYDLSNDTGYWKFESTGIYVDYVEYTKLMSDISSPPRKGEIEIIAALIRGGNLLPESDYRWIDSFKAHVSDQIAQTLWRYAMTLNPEKTPEQMLQISEIIFELEPINEQALYLKCKSYHAKGRHSSAKREYDHFREEYEAVYGEKFPFTFTELLEKTDWE